MFALEMMPFIHPSDPDSYVALLKAVDRESFGVHLDPVNILNSPDRCFNNGKLIKECFDKLGGAILSCHVKDVTLLPTAFPLGIEQCRTGTGLVDYRTYLSELNRLPPDTPLLTEPMPGMQEYEYDPRQRLHHRCCGRNGPVIPVNGRCSSVGVAVDIDSLTTGRAARARSDSAPP